MEDDKRYTSDVEAARLNIEEYHTLGRHINPDEVWRDAQLIEDCPQKHKFSLLEAFSRDNGGEALHSYTTFRDGETVNNLVEKINAAKLTRVLGTKNCYYSPYLIDAFGREFDAPDNEDPAKSWAWEIFINTIDNKLDYAVGDPLLDPKAGTILFRNPDFVKSLTFNTDIYMNFYRYAGRKGAIGTEIGIDLPFRDDLTLFKDHEDDSRNAKVKVFGKDMTTTYVLPEPKLTPDNKRGLGYIGRDNPKLKEIKEYGVVLIEENLNDNLWEQGIINGGVYTENGDVYKQQL